MNFSITPAEREYLRGLALKQKELSQTEENKDKIKRWYAHNDFIERYPMVVMETRYCEDDLYDLTCTSPFAREIELELQRSIVNATFIKDDKVVPDYVTIYWDMSVRTLNLDLGEKRIVDSHGKTVGYETIHHLEDLGEDINKIGETVRSADKSATLAKRDAVLEILGDILPVRIKNDIGFFNWYASPSKKVVYLMGMEAMMFAPYDYPDEFHKLYDILTEDAIATYRWMEKEELLCLNNGNDYAGSGSYGFTKNLPSEGYAKTGKITTKDLWLNINSQETVSISPEMYGEFFFPYYQRLAKEFGQVYYGCCEPANPFWEKYLSTIPNLKKLSISDWADDQLMGDYLRPTKIIYSKKPSPNYIALQGELDEQAYREHIRKSVLAAEGCNLEIICRDVYALYGNRKKLARAVEIIREVLANDFK